MISKSTVKSITALHYKKYRKEENLFIAEGEKVVSDLLSSGWYIKSIYGTDSFFRKIDGKIKIPKRVTVELVTDEELKKISGLTTPQQVLAVVEIPENNNEIDFDNGLKLVLDGISDPGNLGTIIRIADWFGIKEIICSENTVDCFNPKVVQSAMGSLFRVKIIYKNLSEVFNKNLAMNSLPVYGTLLDGRSIYDERLVKDSFILLGNESTGISGDSMKFITDGITIPSYENSKADSLNAAVAAGIICSFFRMGE